MKQEKELHIKGREQKGFWFDLGLLSLFLVLGSYFVFAHTLLWSFFLLAYVLAVVYVVHQASWQLFLDPSGIEIQYWQKWTYQQHRVPWQEVDEMELAYGERKMDIHLQYGGGFHTFHLHYLLVGSPLSRQLLGYSQKALEERFHYYHNSD